MGKAELKQALQELVWAVEADYKCQGIDPRNVLKAHTFVACAMKRADAILALTPTPEAK